VADTREGLRSQENLHPRLAVVATEGIADISQQRNKHFQDVAIAHGDVREGLTNNSGRSRELVERLGGEGIILHNALIMSHLHRSVH
jgi:hypothetical protein